MAGVAAEIEFLSVHCGGHEGDWETINELSAGDEALKAAPWEYTVDLAHQYRHLIGAVASALLREKYLSGTQIDEICEKLREKRAALAEAQ